MTLKMRFLIALLLLPLSAVAATPPQAVSEFVNHPQLRHANISLLVRDVATGRSLAEYCPERVATPASTAKLITTAAALETLGSDFRFQTQVLADGKIERGVLHGNLIIYGQGDPTLGSRYMGDSTFLATFVSQVRSAGILKVEGDVVADASFWGDEGVSPKWSWEDMGNYYGSATYALSIFDDIMEVHFRTGVAGTNATITKVEPIVAGLSIECYVKAAVTKSDNAYFYGAPFDLRRVVRGTLPAASSDFISKADLPNPPLTCATVFRQALMDSGIVVKGLPRASFKVETGSRTPLFSLSSPALSDIVSEINHRSNNHYTEHVYRYLGVKHGDRSVYGGSDYLEKFWKEKGLDVDQMLLYDGCGLSPSDAVTARFFVDLLTWEKKSARNFDAFYASLPVAGESGTVKNLFKGTSLAGKVHAKSGSISGTQCYAGYVEVSGRTLAFAVMVNNFHGSRAAVRAAIERLFLAVTR